MKLWFTILITVTAVAAGVVLARVLAPRASQPPAPAGGAHGPGEGARDERVASMNAPAFHLELVEGVDVNAGEPDVIAGRDDITVWRFATGGHWRQTATESTRVSPALGYSERVRLDPGLPRWLLNGRYPSTLAALQGIVEGGAGIATSGPYVDWSAVEGAVAAGLAQWLPPSTICGHTATGISVPRQTMYPGSDGGEYRVWFDRRRRLRLQREEIVGGRAIHGVWCRRYVQGAAADVTALMSPRSGAAALPETVVEVKAIPLAQAGPFPAGLRPTRAYRLSRTWRGTPPDRMLPAGKIDLFVHESPGAAPAYIFASDASAPAPLRLEWLHDAAPLSGGQYPAGMTNSLSKLTPRNGLEGIAPGAPSFLGSWVNETGLQGAAWLAAGRQWVYIGPAAGLEPVAAALKGEN